MTTPIIRVPIVTGITAGRSIPDDYTDWQITGFREIRGFDLPSHLARFVAVPVEGDSLIEQNICDGDILICKITSHYEDGRIGLWQTPSGRTAKFASYDLDNYVVLHNDADWRQTWNASELRLLGLVVRVERDMI